MPRPSTPSRQRVRQDPARISSSQKRGAQQAVRQALARPLAWNREDAPARRHVQASASALRLEWQRRPFPLLLHPLLTYSALEPEAASLVDLNRLLERLTVEQRVRLRTGLRVREPIPAGLGVGPNANAPGSSSVPARGRDASARVFRERATGLESATSTLGRRTKRTTDSVERQFPTAKVLLTALCAPRGEATGDTWISASTLSTRSSARIVSTTVQSSTERGTMFRVHSPRGVSAAPPRRSLSWRRARDRHTRSHNQGPC